MTLTTFWFGRRLWGLDPLPYHLVNIGLHAINGILVFLILRRLRVPGAWLAACLWVLHPVNVESVAWITELKNVQSGFFFFLSLLCFLRFDAERNHRWYALALVCGLAAMLSKPSTVVLPLVLLLCVGWEHGGWQRGDIARATPFFGLACGMSALTILEQHGQVLRAGAGEWKLGMAERFIIAGKGIWFYAMKALWPVDLMFVYPRWEADARSALLWAPLAAVAVAGVILWRLRRRPWSGRHGLDAGSLSSRCCPCWGSSMCIISGTRMSPTTFNTWRASASSRWPSRRLALWCDNRPGGSRRARSLSRCWVFLAGSIATCFMMRRRCGATSSPGIPGARSRMATSRRY